MSDPTIDATDTSNASAAPDATSEELGDQGVAALKAERAARRAAEKASSDLARRLQEFEDRDKTEAERTAERLAAAEKRAAELETKATRAEVAAAKGVPADLLTGSTQQELEASADALIAFRGDQGSKRLHVPTEGNSPSKQVSDDSEFVKTLFSKGD